MIGQKLTLEEIPASIVELHRKVDLLLIQLQSRTESEQDRYLNISELIDYLPEKPARQTVYGWINYRSIPYEKHGKRLYFKKSAIDLWLVNGRRISNDMVR